MPKTYDTPWGERTVSEVEEAVINIDMFLMDLDDKDDELWARLAREENGTRRGGMTMADVVDFATNEDGTPNKEMVATMKRIIKEGKERLKELNIEQAESEKKIRSQLITLQAKEDQIEQNLVTLRMARENVEHRIGYNERILSLLNRGTQVGTIGTNMPLDIQRAKLFPISDLIEFKHGFAPCIWHNEKTGSMKYYPKTNHVHCFGCKKRGDAIDVVQQLHNLDIKGAVAFLTK